MKKFIMVVSVLVVMMLISVTVYGAGHWYTMHDLNYMMESGDYNSFVMKPVVLETDRAEFVDVNNPKEKMYISYHKGYFAGRGHMQLNDRSWGEKSLFDFINTLATEPNRVETTMGASYKGNRDDLISFNYEYTYTDENGYNGFKEIMMLKNGEDLYLVKYYCDAATYETDRTRDMLHYYYYYGARREGDESAPVYKEKPLPIKLVIDGAEIVSDAEPLIKDDRTLVPVRTVGNGLGYGVDWDESTRTAILQKDKTTLKIDINHDIIRKQFVEYDTQTGIDVIKNEQFKTDVPAQIIDGRTYLPVRAVSEALGCKVDWDGTTRTVTITTLKTQEAQIQTVYIGETGDTYHKKRNCAHLPNNSGAGVPFDFAVKNGLIRCELCWD